MLPLVNIWKSHDRSNSFHFSSSLIKVVSHLHMPIMPENWVNFNTLQLHHFSRPEPCPWAALVLQQDVVPIAKHSRREPQLCPKKHLGAVPAVVSTGKWFQPWACFHVMIISTNFVRSPYQVQFIQYIDVYSKNHWFGTCPVPKKIRIGSKYAKVMCHKWSPIESISSRWHKLKCTAGLSLLQAGTCSQCLVQMSVVACCLSASLATECFEFFHRLFCRSIALFCASSLQPFQGCQRSEAQVLPEVPLRGDELKCCMHMKFNARHPHQRHLETKSWWRNWGM